MASKSVATAAMNNTVEMSGTTKNGCVIPEEIHEKADNNLAKVAGIIDALSDGDHNGGTKAALWAARDLLDEARELYGKY